MHAGLGKEQNSVNSVNMREVLPTRRDHLVASNVATAAADECRNATAARPTHSVSSPGSGRRLGQIQSAFTDNMPPKIGAELELWLVDQHTGRPLPIFDRIVANIPIELQPQNHAEYLACQIELVSKPCVTVGHLRADLSKLVRSVQAAARRFGARLMWHATHPDWRFDGSRLRTFAS